MNNIKRGMILMNATGSYYLVVFDQNGEICFEPVEISGYGFFVCATDDCLIYKNREEDGTYTFVRVDYDGTQKEIFSTKDDPNVNIGNAYPEYGLNELHSRGTGFINFDGETVISAAAITR